jgi:starch phosphorylase
VDSGLLLIQQRFERIREEVGADNFFVFGLTAEQVFELKAKGYHPKQHYDSDRELREAVS